MHGIITMRSLLVHLPTVVREFGCDVLVRCCIAVLRRQETTFLALAVRLPQGARGARAQIGETPRDGAS